MPSAESTWQDLFDTFSSDEQSCVRDSLGDRQLAEMLATAVLHYTSSVLSVGRVFGCLREDTAADLFISLTVASVENSGIPIDAETGLCFGRTVDEFKVEHGHEIGPLIAGALEDPASDEAGDYALLGLGLIGCLPEEVLEAAFGPDTAQARINPPDDALLWTFSTGVEGELVTVSPTVGDGAVYAASYNGAVYALDIDTGELLWSFKTASGVSPPVNVVSGSVHVADLDTHYALDAATGELLWSTEASSAAIDEPQVVGGAIVMQQRGRDELVVTARDAHSGEVIWTAATPASGFVLFPVTASADRLYISDDGATHALDPATGELQWSFPPEGASAEAGVVRPVASGGSVFLMSRDAVHALDEARGELLWSNDIGDIAILDYSPPAVTGDALYVLTEDLVAFDSASTLHALDAATGYALWSSELPHSLLAPTLADGRVYVIDHAAAVHALDSATGELIWTSEPQMGARLHETEGIVYAHYFGDLNALDAATGELIWSIDAIFVGGGHRVFAVSDGTVFAGHQGTGSGVHAYRAPDAGHLSVEKATGMDFLTEGGSAGSADPSSGLAPAGDTDQRFTLTGVLDLRTFVIDHEGSDDVDVTLHDCGDAEMAVTDPFGPLSGRDGDGELPRSVRLAADEALLSFVTVYWVGSGSVECRLHSNAVLVEYLDEDGAALPFRSDGNAQHSGGFDYYADYDVYVVDLSRDDTITVWVDSPDADTGLILLDEDGVVAADDDSGPRGLWNNDYNPEIVYQATASGRHLVVVGYSPLTSSSPTGSYTLIAARNN